jgi:hypothetical protein
MAAVEGDQQSLHAVDHDFTQRSFAQTDHAERADHTPDR